MSNQTTNEKSVIRNIIIASQHLDKRSSKRIEEIVSDICGLQYDPNPTIHLNHYMMLWNRKKDFAVEDLDAAAYKEFKITDAAQDSEEVRLISPMNILVRDQTWLKKFFDYSYTFEYFKKKGMKWPLLILVGNRFAGYFDCKMEWRTRRFLIKEKNIFDSAFYNHKGIELALRFYC